MRNERYQTRRLHAAGFFNRHKTFEAQTWNQNLFYTSSWNRTIKVITKSDWPLGLGGGVIINYSGTVTWEVPFSSCRLFLSCIRGAMNQVSSFGILNKQDQELSLHNVSVYLVVKINVQISAQQDPHTIWLIKTNSCFHPYLPSSNRWHEPQLRGAQVRPSPPYSITSWNYCCKSNVKVNLGDYNPSTHGGRIIF